MAEISFHNSEAFAVELHLKVEILSDALIFSPSFALRSEDLFVQHFVDLFVFVEGQFSVGDDDLSLVYLGRSDEQHSELVIPMAFLAWL